MNILRTHYKADGSCVIDAEIDEVERQFLIEFALTKIIEEYVEELSKEALPKSTNVARTYRAETGKVWPNAETQ